jgi:hypothetical protein
VGMHRAGRSLAIHFFDQRGLVTYTKTAVSYHTASVHVKLARLCYNR